jgi:hypothetical protein
MYIGGGALNLKNREPSRYVFTNRNFSEYKACRNSRQAFFMTGKINTI